MQITVYYDVVFLLNFFVVLVVLFLTGILAKRKILWGRIIIGAVLAAISLLIFILCPSLFIGWKGVVILIGISMGTVAIPYWEKGWSFVRTWFLSTTVMILIGGIMNYFKYIFQVTKLHMKTWLFVFTGSCVCIAIIVISLRNVFKQNKNIYLVQFVHGEHVTVETMYLDTGNMLMDPMFQKPVVIMGYNAITKCMIEEERRVVEQYIKTGKLDYELLLSCQTQKKVCFHELPYQSIGESSGKLICLLIDEIKIFGGDRVLEKQPVAIVPDEVFRGNIYQGLLHRECI